MAAQIFFLDTNVLLECKALEELPWKEISDEDPIRLIIALTVVGEIDKRKNGNDRKADRARKASQRFRLIRDSPDKRIAVRETAPRVSLEIAPRYFPKDSDFPDFDLSRPDNRMIAEAKNFSKGCSEGAVSILTDDTIPTILAEAYGICATAVPKEWLLPPESDQKDEKIRAQAEEIKFPSIAFAQAKLVFYSAHNEELAQFFPSLARYRAFKEEEIEELVEAVRAAHPPLQLTTSVVQQIRFHGQPVHPLRAE
jgi:hypothetical protein